MGTLGSRNHYLEIQLNQYSSSIKFWIKQAAKAYRLFEEGKSLFPSIVDLKAYGIKIGSDYFGELSKGDKIFGGCFAFWLISKY